MKKVTFTLLLFCMVVSTVYSQTQFSSATIKWKKNGVWYSNTYYPNSQGAISPDQGTQINITVTRTSNASLPVKFIVWDVNNYQTHVLESSLSSQLFTNCIGPLNTEIRIGVNSMTDFARITVSWTNPPKADLTMTTLLVNGSLSTGDLSYYVGQTVDITARVSNVGGAEATSSSLGVYIKTLRDNTSGSPVSSARVYSVKAGSTLQYTFTYKFTSSDAGSRYFVFKADHATEVTEANENNNVKSFGPFTVVAPANLKLLPATYSFGIVEVNKCSPEQDFILTNDGGTRASISSVSPGASSHFEIISGGGSFYLDAGKSRTIKVRFCPHSAGAKTDILKIYSTGVNTPVTQASITGSGTTPPEAIVANSPEFLFDTKTSVAKSGGIFLKIIETAGTKIVNKIGYEYRYGANPPLQNKFPVDENGYVFLKHPEYPNSETINDFVEKNDFEDILMLFDEKDKLIGHIPFSYSFEWESTCARHAIIFLHNDGPVLSLGNDNSAFMRFNGTKGVGISVRCVRD